MDKILISDFTCPVRIGCTANERAFPQLLTFSLELGCDLARSSQSDQLTDTVDYMAVMQAINRFCSESEWKLIEKLAADVITELFAEFRLIQVIDIEIRKRVTADAQWVAVRMERAR